MARNSIFIMILALSGLIQLKAQEPVLQFEDTLLVQDSVQLAKKTKFYIPKKAAMLSAAFPGLGQIYNGKWWKVPILYAGVAATIYGISWNNGYYTKYKSGYYDWIDSDPYSQSYLEVLPPNSNIENIDASWFESQLEAKKDSYRRDRDLMIIVAVGVYMINIIDANVDAHLSDFDVTPDLSMRVSPSLIYSQGQASLGLACCFKF